MDLKEFASAYFSKRYDNVLHGVDPEPQQVSNKRLCA